MLPEGSAHYDKLSRLYLADAYETQLRIGATHHHRRSFFQAGIDGCLPVYLAQHSTWFVRRWQNVHTQPAHLYDLSRPGAPCQVEHPRTGANRRVRDVLPTQLEQNPVTEHREVSDVLEDFRLMSL